MREGKPAICIWGNIARAGRKPTFEISQGNSGMVSFQLIITLVADLFLNNTRRIKVRFTANTTIPTHIVPSQTCGEMDH
jgi:hypothetical protein